jgi:hypothetical protein
MRAVVLTVDQQGSTKDAAPDLVPDAVELLTALGPLLAFERTAGDELQGVLAPETLSPALELLLRAETWNVGIGVAAVEAPLPPSVRAARGEAFVLAREAVAAAKSAPWRVSVRGDREGARHLESAVWLWAALLRRRTAAGWEVADLVDTGLRYDDVAGRLGISPSAVSQRAQAAGIVEGRRARELVTALAVDLVGDTAAAAAAGGTR